MRVWSDVVSPVRPLCLLLLPLSTLTLTQSLHAWPGGSDQRLHFTLPIIVSPSLRSEEIVSTIWIGNQIFTVINLIRYFVLTK